MTKQCWMVPSLRRFGGLWLAGLILGAGSVGLAAAESPGGGRPTAAERAEYQRLARHCRDLLDTSLIQFYLPACVDTNQGGYFEVLREGRFAPGTEKFLTLQARQVWFFSTLAAEGIQRESALRAARHGFDFLQRAFLDTTNGGYYSKVSNDGRPVDPRKHAYLNSFALYALAAYHRASGDPAALAAAQSLFRTLDARAHDGTNGGYQEFFYEDWRPVTDPGEAGYVGAIGTKTYNTHLHLLESFAELYREWPEPALRGRLAELLVINTSTVRNAEHQCNVDGWHPDWRVVNTPRNLRASYGHDVECAWLALDAARTLGQSPALLRSWAESLCATSLRFGYDAAHGGFFNSGPLGQPADDQGKEWWVQAEALVGLLEMFQLTGDRQYFERFRQTLAFVEQHQVAKEGGWWATRRADGSPAANLSRTSPWQGAYHNGRALLRCARLLTDLAAREP
jgi:mannobiose 2-epimerase